jgi:cobalamin synthase
MLMKKDSAPRERACGKDTVGRKKISIVSLASLLFLILCSAVEIATAIVTASMAVTAAMAAARRTARNEKRKRERP